MLVLTRQIGEQIVIDNGITATLMAIRGDKVRLGINAPRVSAWTARKFMSAAWRHARLFGGHRFPLASKE
jgi:hypothetical protein